jgi:hypothetical protein
MIDGRHPIRSTVDSSPRLQEVRVTLEYIPLALGGGGVVQSLEEE